VSRDGFLESLVLNVTSMLEGPLGNCFATLSSILLGMLVRLKSIDEGFGFAVDWVLYFDCFPRAFDLDAFDQLIWILGQVGACCALLSPIAFVAARDSVLVVSVTCSSVHIKRLTNRFPVCL